jgi:sugar phosphate permease
MGLHSADPQRYRWMIFGILALGYPLVYFHRLAPAVVAVDMARDFHAGGTLLGFLGAAYFYPYALMQLPAGLLSDSWGPRKTITFFFMVAFGGSVLMGLAPSLFWAIVGRGLVGMGIAMLFVPTMKVLAEWFRVREFAFMTGILMAMGGVGSLTAAAPLAFLSSWVGWRFSFIAVGVITFLLALLVWTFVRDRPADLGWPSPGEARVIAPQPIGLMEGVRRVLTSAPFWPLALWFFFICAIFLAFGGLWGGPYLIHIYGLSKGEAGRVLSMLGIGLIAGSPLLGFASNSLFNGRKPVIILASAMALFLTAPLAFFTERIPLPGLYLICLGLGMFTSAIVVVGFTSAKELFPVQIAGTATGLVNFFPFVGGAVFQPLLGYLLESQGKVQDAYTLQGYRHAFFALFLCALAALASSLLLKETMARRAPRRGERALAGK